ncbi:hypothetical protein J6590_060200 [Homalodisca vitripennis]|nr:hypothetical protein J6590_060200 [Homalodisca vitripennis]
MCYVQASLKLHAKFRIHSLFHCANREAIALNRTLELLVHWSTARICFDYRDTKLFRLNLIQFGTVPKLRISDAEVSAAWAAAKRNVAQWGI